MSVPFYASMDITQELGQIPPGFDNSPEPISTYRENEPVPVSSYQESAPVPVATYEEKDDYWQNGFRAENNNEEHFPKDDNGEAGSNHMKTDLNELPPVPQGSSGEGLPYAPVDWPNPGDVWTWRVGRRLNKEGFHQDRFLILPQRLQKRNIPKSFASKQSIARYIEMEFPGADVNAFFSSFSWKVPCSYHHETKINTAALFEEAPDVKGEQERVESGEKQPEDVKQGNSRYSQRKRKPMKPQFKEPTEQQPKPAGRPGRKRKDKAGAATTTSTLGSVPASSKQKTRQSSRRTARQSYGEVDLNDDATPVGKLTKRRKADFEDEQVSIPHIYVSPVNGVIAVSHSPVEINQEEFDSYLNSLDNLLAQPPPEGQVSAIVHAGSPIREYELAEARMKLASLLDQDFPSLFYSKEVSELTNLAVKLRKDPSLSAEELVKLKLVEEIPSFSEVFQENKATIEEADKFFSSLELNKAKVASLKYEYSDLKDKLSHIQMEVDSNTQAIREIDEQIAQLQARRSELTHAIGNKKKERVDLNYAQKMVANSIPNVVQEVQTSNSKKPEWELKKENALKRESEILAKFAPLKGFYLHPSFSNLF